MTPGREDRLILTLPSDPRLAPLTRLVTLHFLRQNGVGVVKARIGARTVEKRCRASLRTARRTASALVLVLTAGARAVEASDRSGTRGHGSRILRLERPGPV